MKRSELRLNDFDGFERFLFTDVEMDLPAYERWYKYFSWSLIEGDPRFYQPIYEPKTIEEFQLCHYAYWMVIYVFELFKKPEIWDSAFHNRTKCYACLYEYMWLTIHNISFIKPLCPCPIKVWRASPCFIAYSEFKEWQRDKNPDRAKRIAMYEWMDLNPAEFTSPLIERSE